MPVKSDIPNWKDQEMTKKTIKLATGSVYQKKTGGVYFFRYQINNQRKCVSLETRNREEAIAKAGKIVPVVRATSTEVIAAHVKQARNLEHRQQELALSDAWEVYSRHPERSVPDTVHEQNTYRATFREFVDFINKPELPIREITPELAAKYADHLRSCRISVSTHNRKITRIRKIFEVLRDYRDADNPFRSRVLMRKEREEQELGVRRLSFSREQIQKLREVLDDSIHKVMYKPEVKVIYYLGMFTGQRLKDCVLLRWDSIDFPHGQIWVKQFKTGKEVTIPIAPELKTVLEAAWSWRIDEYVCPRVAARYKRTDAAGKNVGNNLVNIDVLRVIQWIGLEPSVAVPGRKKKVTIYGFHSLRHSFASYCAEANVPKAAVQSILGTDSDIVDKYYTHVGREAQEKAIAAVVGEIGGESDRNRIEKALALIRSSTADPAETLKLVAAILEQ